MATEQELAKLEKEVFTNINPETLPEDLKPLYKNMLGDYTRKTQELSARRKDFDTKESTYQNKLKSLGALEQEVTQWRNWYQSLESETDGTTDKSDSSSTSDIGLTDDAKLAATISTLEREVGSLKSELKSAHSAIRDSHVQVNKMFTYQSQLNDITQKHPKVDKTKLLEFAVQHGLSDLNDAYERLHRPDIIEEEVQKRLTEELSKARTDGIHSSGHQMIIRSNSEGSPKSFAEATEQIVQQKAREGTLE